MVPAPDGGGHDEMPEGGAVYVFGAVVELDPDEPGVWAEPGTVETTVYREADPPGDPGWLYFRDNLWHGECNDAEHMRSVTEAALDAPVSRVEFRELRTTPGYLERLREAIAADLAAFNAATVDEVVSKYLGSSVRVVDGE
ncbi:MAG: LWR-salt protein [Haloarculaceae archaeon]